MIDSDSDFAQGKQSQIIKEYLDNASTYERQAIEILRQQGNTMLLGKVLHRDGREYWSVFTKDEAKKNIANYPADHRYHSTTGYYNIVETMVIN